MPLGHPRGFSLARCCLVLVACGGEPNNSVIDAGPSTDASITEDSTASSDSPPPCTLGQQRCASSKVLETCGSGYTWQSTPCAEPTPTCVSDQCACTGNVCMASSTCIPKNACCTNTDC